MENAVAEWMLSSFGSCGVALTPGMNFVLQKVNLAPEVARLVDVYRNTTLMITHIIHRLLVKAGQLAPRADNHCFNELLALFKCHT